MERPGLEDDLVQGRLFTYPLHSILVSTQRCLPPEDVLDLFEEEELDKLESAHKQPIQTREKGQGRPTKKERRVMDKVREKY